MMDAITSETIFQPYKIINQSRSSLQLQPATGQKVVVYIFRFMPLIMLSIGLALYLSQKQTLYLATFGGIALLEWFIFSFIKIPAALSMDNMGFTIELLSLRGSIEMYYLWSDVDFIRYKTVRTKNNTSLHYEAVLNTGKKRGFLNFPNYYSKKKQIAEINAALHEISRKDIKEK